MSHDFNAFRWRRRRAWVRKRSDRDGFWCNFIDSDGQRHSFKYPTREAAEAAKREIEARLNEQANPWAKPLQPRPWLDVVGEYAAALANAAPSYCKEVDRNLDFFRRIIDPKHSNAVTPADIERYLAARAAGQPPLLNRKGVIQIDERGQPRLGPRVAAATLQKEYRCLHTFFAWCSDDQRRYAAANPCKAVRKPKAPTRVKDTPSADEWVRLLEAVSDDTCPIRERQAWHLLILLACITDLRRGVLLSLRVAKAKRDEQDELRKGRRDWAHVELGDASTAGAGIVHAFTGKTLRESVHGLPPLLNDRIARRIDDLPHDAPHLPRIFPWRHFPRRAWERIVTHAKLSFDFHSLRRAGGNWAAIQAGQRAAAAALDHSSLQVTRRHYLDDRGLARKVAAALQLPPGIPPLPPYRDPPTPTPPPAKNATALPPAAPAAPGRADTPR